MTAELSHMQYMLAGGTAGVMEHVCMFPVDLVKTRMQSLAGQQRYSGSGILDVFRSVLRKEGASKLYSGLSAVVLVAPLAHGAYFTLYEAMQRFLSGTTPNPTLRAICAGAIATIGHDCISTPFDVLKQRMQMHTGRYRTFVHCLGDTVKNEGAGVLTRSLPTTIVMNLPQHIAQWTTYEAFKMVFELRGVNIGDEDNPTWQFLVGGALAGACGGACSNPFDVMKTRIQLSELSGCTRLSLTASQPEFLMRAVAKDIYATHGWKGFWRGSTARVLYCAPATAICMTSYEVAKFFLTRL